jgi:hypothetical protein
MAAVDGVIASRSDAGCCKSLFLSSLMPVAAPWHSTYSASSVLMARPVFR